MTFDMIYRLTKGMKNFMKSSALVLTGALLIAACGNKEQKREANVNEDPTQEKEGFGPLFAFHLIWVLRNSIKSYTFAHNDNDIRYRTADSAIGHDAWLGIRLFHERRYVAPSTEDTFGLCLRCDGGGVGLVVAHTRNGDGS